MNISLYNSLTRCKEIFQPLDVNLVTMYVCGPTVYDTPHIGNGRSAVIYDVLYRFLRYSFGANKVLYVRNITDVDDKIIYKAAQTGLTIQRVTEITTAEFQASMDYLHCIKPNVEPKATEHINHMIEIIQKLLDNGCAYAAENHVYFDVSKAESYTALSGRNLQDMLNSVRIEQSPGKKDSADFVLWKPEVFGEDINANFDSPFGRGRPGWHIECSAMSHTYLGENFDIHGGGVDLIFPHHTNEIAQSTCAFPGSKFAKYWVHNGFLTVGGEKMSKSLGNFVTIQDLTDKKISGEVVRLFFLSASYRKPLDFNDKALHDAEKMISFWQQTVYKAGITDSSQNQDAAMPKEFIAALADDLNTPLAIKLINDYAKEANGVSAAKEQRKYAAMVLFCARLIGLMQEITIPQKAELPIELVQKIEALILERKQAKAAKNWQRADELRATLQNEYNVVLEDKPDGSTSW